MLDIGKQNYENIVIPDDKLLAAIGKGIHKEKRIRGKKLIRNFTVAAAACMMLLFSCANIPALYAYANEIPFIKTFVQAFHVGSGGKELENTTVEISSDSNSITITFLLEGKITNEVASYSASYHYAPVRMQMTFHQMDSSL